MVSCSLPIIFCPPLRSSMLKDMFTNYSVKTFFLNALGKWKKAKHVRNADDAWLGMNPGEERQRTLWMRWGSFPTWRLQDFTLKAQALKKYTGKTHR